MREVVPLLDEAAMDMWRGEMLCGDFFDIHDAMSSLEVMDAQMDTGMAVCTEEINPTTASHALPAPLIIGLLDDVMCAEHGWFCGLPLTQTVYAIEWVHRAPEVVDVPTRAALLAAARGVAVTRSVIMRGDVCDEEDIAGSVWRIDLHDDVSDAELVSVLDAAEGCCAAAVAAARAEAARTTISLRSAAEDAVAEASAVLCRMRFRRGFCGALLNMARLGDASNEIAEKMIDLAEEQLHEIATSVQLGMPRTHFTYCTEGRIVGHAPGTLPARTPAWLERAQGVAASRKLLAELRTICTLTTASSSYDRFMRWFDDLVELPRPGPHVLTRSAAQLFAVTEDPRLRLRPSMATYLAAAVTAHAGIESGLARGLIALPPVADFMQQLAHGELARLRLKNLNRGRARRRLRHYLADWAPLQDLAEALDARLQHGGYLPAGMGPYGAWCLQHTLADMLHFINLGFELELFAPCEFAFTYWYADLLCSMVIQVYRETDTACAHAQAQAQAQAQVAAAAMSGKRSRKATRGKEKSTKGPSLLHTVAAQHKLLFTRVQLDLSRGAYLLLSALEHAGHLPACNFEFLPLERRFARRFAPFRTLARPPPLSSRHYAKAAAQLAGSVLSDMLSAAANHFRAAKAHLDAPLKANGLSSAQRAEAMALAKVAIANGVLIASLSLRKPVPSTCTKCSFATHSHFVVVTMHGDPGST